VGGTSSVAKLGHAGAHALPIGGCDLPLEVCPTNIKQLPQVTTCSEISILRCVCGRQLNLGQIERAMSTLSGQLTSGVARHRPSRERPTLLVTYHAYLIPFHEVLYN